MSTRIRFWALGVLAMLIAYPLAAWTIGIAVERQTRDGEQAALEKVGPYLSIVQRTYRRGVFGASEVITFAVDTHGLKSPASTALSAFRLTARNAIRHGPFPGGRTFALATIDTELVLPPQVQQRLNALFAGKKPYTLHTSLGWLGGRRVEFSSPSAGGEVAPGTTLSSGGISGTVTVTPNGSTNVDFTAKHLAANSQGLRAQLDDLRLKSAMQRRFGTLSLGDASLTLSRLEFRGKSPGDKPVSLQNIEVSSHSSATGDYISYDGRLTTGPAHLARFTVTRMEYQFTGTHIYGPALASLLDNIRSISRAAAAATSNPQSAQQLRQQIGEAARKDGIDLLLHDPVIDIPHLDYAMPEGTFSLSARMTAPGLKREDLERGGPAVIAALLQHLQAKADLRVDTDLLDKMTEGTPGNGDRLATAARQLEAQGYIAHEGNALSAHLRFDHGKLSLNGKPFPPSRAGPQP